jgi:hypothetical protein
VREKRAANLSAVINCPKSKVKTSSTYYHINDRNGKKLEFTKESDREVKIMKRASGVADKNESTCQERSGGGKNWGQRAGMGVKIWGEKYKTRVKVIK